MNIYSQNYDRVIQELKENDKNKLNGVYQLFDSIKIKADSLFIQKENDETNLVDTKTAWTLNSMQAIQNCKLLDRLGISGWALAVSLISSASAFVPSPIKSKSIRIDH